LLDQSSRVDDSRVYMLTNRDRIQMDCHASLIYALVQECFWSSCNIRSNNKGRNVYSASRVQNHLWANCFYSKTVHRRNSSIANFAR